MEEENENLDSLNDLDLISDDPILEDEVEEIDDFDENTDFSGEDDDLFGLGDEDDPDAVIEDSYDDDYSY